MNTPSSDKLVESNRQSPKINNLVEVIKSCHSVIQTGYVGRVKKVFTKGCAVVFVNARHPQSRSLHTYSGQNTDITLFLPHTDYKLYVNTKSTDSVQAGNESTGPVTSHIPEPFE